MTPQHNGVAALFNRRVDQRSRQTKAALTT